MKLSEFVESAFLEELRCRFPADERVPIGIGDDAAALVVPDGERVLLTVDALVEGIHFTRETLAPRFLGRKAIAVSASDIAAMGGVGLGALLSLVVPRELEVETLWEIVDGASERARELEMALVGGNLSASRTETVVDVTVCGTTLDGRALRRNGARAGDGIYLSGKIGASVCGMELLRRGVKLSSSGGVIVPEALRDGPLTHAEACIRAHVEPAPRLELGRALNARRIATACIDVSDGLALDLGRLCRASGVGATIDEASLPLHPGILAWARTWGRDATELALTGGEDYELLFTARKAKQVDRVRDELDVAVTRIGELTDGNGVELVRRHGGVERLTSSGRTGWDHFRHD